MGEYLQTVRYEAVAARRGDRVLLVVFLLLVVAGTGLSYPGFGPIWTEPNRHWAVAFAGSGLSREVQIGLNDASVTVLGVGHSVNYSTLVAACQGEISDDWLSTLLSFVPGACEVSEELLNNGWIAWLLMLTAAVVGLVSSVAALVYLFSKSTRVGGGGGGGGGVVVDSACSKIGASLLVGFFPVVCLVAAGTGVALFGKAMHDLAKLSEDGLLGKLEWRPDYALSCVLGAIAAFFLAAVTGVFALRNMFHAAADEARRRAYHLPDLELDALTDDNPFYDHE